MKNLRLEAGQALIVVAHPDDETIWMGGTILQNQHLDWTIFSLCRKDDLDRTPKFLKVCKFYKAHSIISDLEDEGIMDIKESLPEIEKRFINNLPKKSYTYIFTHGKNGEYGHLRHQGVHQIVKKLTRNKFLISKKLYFFDYEKLPNKKIPTPCQDADFYVSLKIADFKIKRKIITNMYGFSLESFEHNSCAKMETFKTTA